MGNKVLKMANSIKLASKQNTLNKQAEIYAIALLEAEIVERKLLADRIKNNCLTKLDELNLKLKQ